jgi:hypothetical protein
MKQPNLVTLQTRVLLAIEDACLAGKGLHEVKIAVNNAFIKFLEEHLKELEKC